MALIKCKGCGKMVSTRAESCPKCGYSVRLSMEQREDVENTVITPSIPEDTEQKKHEYDYDDFQSKKNNKTGVFIAVIVILVICCGISIFLLNKEKNNNLENQNSSTIVTDTGLVENNSTINKEAEQSSSISTTTEANHDAVGPESNTTEDKESIILYGSMTDANGTNPIEISYDRDGDELTNCIYTNVDLGGKIRMEGEISGENLIFTGKDGKNKFQIIIDRESFEGVATDGPKELSVSLDRRY